MAPGGYAWWYVDALSDDGRFGITLIAFIGSVFSPYYAAARRRTPGGLADPFEHCAINVALYERGGKHRWAMTERGSTRLSRSTCTLQIGPSALSWQRDTLTICLDEVTVPWPSRIHGVVRLHAGSGSGHSVALDAHGAHRWSVLAPCARVEVELNEPGLCWSGPGYLDCNNGDTPLENGFARWDWSRARLQDNSTVVFYDVHRSDGGERSWRLRFTPDGRVKPVAAPEVAALPNTAWRLARSSRCESGHPARVLQTLENGPFYARSLLDARWCGEPVMAVHESVSMQRFGARWVQAMLPFRMPRRSR